MSHLRGVYLSAVIAALLCMTGCAQRAQLSFREFAELQVIDPELDDLRVFPGKRLVSVYAELDDERSVSVARDKVTVRGARRPLERVISVDTPGRVLALEESNEMLLLWVTFYGDCMTKECAYGFVMTERDKFSLMVVPEVTGYAPAMSYRGTRTQRNKLKLGRQRSVGELNEILLVTRRRGKKMLSLDLEIRKDTYKPTRKTREVAPGV